MNRTYRVWYLLALLLALAPVGARSLLWQRARTQLVDADMARAGETLFSHKFIANDPLCPEGDGVGPIFNASSCLECHHQGGPGGSGGLAHNVTTFTVRSGGKSREGVLHAQHVLGDHMRETLQHVHPGLPAEANPPLARVLQLPGQRVPFSELPGRRDIHCVQFPRGVHISQRNTPALFGSKLIDEIPERVIVGGAHYQKLKWAGAPSDDEDKPVGRALRLANGKVGRFGWKAQMATLSDFVQAACANELGLSNPGQAQPVPIYASASAPAKKGYDLTQRQCDELTAFCASLPRPAEKLSGDVSTEQAAAGKAVFTKIGCAECHTPKLGSVDGIYSDLLLHSMGQDLVGGGSYGEPPLPPEPGSPDEGPSPSEWRTPPLWGVADSAPYLHDGRATTLTDAITMHGGQGARSAEKFKALAAREKEQLLAFLRTLRAP
jgi:CxxC motif-containing protein (DUF1111 family)